MLDFVPATVESVRSTIVHHGLVQEGELNAALTACRSHLGDPDTVSTYVTVAQVWGRRRRSSVAPSSGLERTAKPAVQSERWMSINRGDIQ
jgi:hypothetical protein